MVLCDHAFFLQERPNKCLMNGCNMSFNSVDALQKHMLRHFEHSPPTATSCSPPKKHFKVSPGKSHGTCSSGSRDRREMTGGVAPVVRVKEEEVEESSVMDTVPGPVVEGNGRI